MMISTYLIWLIASLFLIILEVAGIFGLTAFLSGISAMIVGVLIERGIVGAESYFLQAILFCTLSSCFIGALWLKTKNTKQEEYIDIEGADAVVISCPRRGAPGKIRWSGTVMSARFIDDEQLQIGQLVKIVKIKGNTAYVKGDN